MQYPADSALQWQGLHGHGSSPPKNIKRFPSKTLYATQPEVFRIAAQKGMGFSSCSATVTLNGMTPLPHILLIKILTARQPCGSPIGCHVKQGISHSTQGAMQAGWVCVNLSKVLLALCKQAPLSSEQHAAQVDRMLRAIPTPRLPPRLTASTSLMGIRNRTRARKQAKIGATSAGVTAFMARQSDCPHTQPFAEVSLYLRKRGGLIQNSLQKPVA